MKIPEDFLKKMKILLGDEEFKLFLKSYDYPGHHGLRVNTLKISVEEFLKISPFHLKPIPWTKDGFYYSKDENPGKHPFYHSGLYYIQEPSAMFPGAVIDAKPGEYILDLRKHTAYCRNLEVFHNKSFYPLQIQNL
jgi:16S rRNA C967 or C1407 C5-methylase (RsmB/RsmF family)